MSKINQIQAGIKSLDGTAFHKLADAYLRKKDKRYERMNSIGSLPGANKPKKGTPDTLITQPNGKYIFAEHTSQSVELYKKLRGDLAKCFNEKKTGIPVSKIEEVVFCHTSDLKSGEIHALASECQKRGVNFAHHGITRISFDLMEKYPGIAKDHLGIEIDTGQIVAMPDFIQAYGKNRLATRLDTSFHHREEELEQIVTLLQSEDVVVLTGRSGVGKSRIALECCKQFGEMHPEYTIKCLYNRANQDIYQDLRVHFSAPGSFLILVDDANRISSFEYIIDLLQHQRHGQTIKVIITVRDYAVEKVRDEIKKYHVAREVIISSLDDDKIKELIRNEYAITNPLYLERIANIAHGNPRLAMMAAEVAKAKNALHSISDVTDLHDRYFTSIRQDLNDLDDEDLLKVAAIVAFLRAIDLTNEEMMSTIESAFGIPPESFSQAVARLCDMEVVDVYDDEVVRVGDQVLATYFVYLAFFKEKVLDFSALLEHFFSRFRHRLVDAINPVISAFNAESIVELMRAHVGRYWDVLVARNDEETLFQLMRSFALLKPTETLLYVQQHIAKLSGKSLDAGDDIYRSGRLLEVLKGFSNADASNLRIAIKLLCDLVALDESLQEQAQDLLQHEFGFKWSSYAAGYEQQALILDTLWEQCREGESVLNATIFLAVSDAYLCTEHQTFEPEDENTITVHTFKLVPSDELRSLRETTWNRIFTLALIPDLQPAVLDLLRNYCDAGADISNPEIVAWDAALIQPFIEVRLDPSRFDHCLLADKYLDLLKYHTIPERDGLRTRFITEVLKLNSLLNRDRRELNLEFSAYKKLHRDRIDEYTRALDYDGWVNLIRQCQEIQQGLPDKNKLYRIGDSFGIALVLLGERVPDLFVCVVEHYLKEGNPLNLSPNPLIEELIKACGPDRAYSILCKFGYPGRRSWLFSYYEVLRPEDIRQHHLAGLYDLYRDAENADLPWSFICLLNYRKYDRSVVVQIAEKLLNRYPRDIKVGGALKALFDDYQDHDIVELFDGSLSVLKSAYIVADADDSHDCDSIVFGKIISADPGFLIQYTDYLYDNKETSLEANKCRDYSFLWEQECYKAVVSRLIERVHERESGGRFRNSVHLQDFFKTREGGNVKLIRKRQDEFILTYIEQYADDQKRMVTVFELVSDFPVERRRLFVAEFIKHNDSFELFKVLPLEPWGWNWSGSEAPVLQKRIEYLDSLLPILDTSYLLEHRLHIEKRIQRLRGDAERAKKSDFMRD